MSYGDVAALCGQPAAARVVGGLAHFGPAELPWHRVVNRHGGMAAGYPGGKPGHQAALEAEGLKVDEFTIVNFPEERWQPNSR